MADWGSEDYLNDYSVSSNDMYYNVPKKKQKKHNEEPPKNEYQRNNFTVKNDEPEKIPYININLSVNEMILILLFIIIIINLFILKIVYTYISSNTE